MEVLRVEHLSKEFGGIHAVRDVSFNVESGERLAIIGPNGAGKTTLFKLLSGSLSPSSGRLFFLEHDITHMQEHLRTHLGMARSYQITTLFNNLSTLENVLLALQGTKPSRFQIFRSARSYEPLYERAYELLDAVDLWEKKDDLVRTISYGEQRKLEITLCLASHPKLLLLDEATTGLTTDESDEIMRRLRNLGENITLIFVAHDMDLVFGIAERIIVLHYGELIASGTCDQIRTNSRVNEIYIGVEETDD